MKHLEHNHHLPAGDYRTPEDKQAARLARCPICSKHDHSDKRPFGYDNDMQPVPGWWFNCPRCGTAESQVHVNRWTADGIAWEHDNPGFMGEYFHEVLADQMVIINERAAAARAKNVEDL